jgi:hypothetical protein
MFLQLIFILVLLIPILSIVLDSQVGKALASRLEGRRIGGSDDLLADRMAYLEGEVERLTGEVDRLSEEGEFLQKLLTERSPTESLPPGDPES